MTNQQLIDTTRSRRRRFLVSALRFPLNLATVLCLAWLFLAGLGLVARLIWSCLTFGWNALPL